MVPTYPSPTPEAVAELLEGLLGREVMVTLKPGIALGPRDPGAVAVYQNDDQEVAAVLLCDLALAVRTGAALSMIPTDAANESVRQKHLEGTILENVSEVFNIGAQLFNGSGRPRLHFLATHVTPPPPEQEVILIVARPNARVDYAVELDEYGGGKMTLLSK